MNKDERNDLKNHNQNPTKVDQNNRHVKHNPNDKIDYLHKMLDNQISTVNSLFQKDNAFEQIQAKLKQLQVKLNSIKDDNSHINYQQFQSNQPSRVQSRTKQIFSIQNSIAKQNFSSSKISLPFESLSAHKKQSRLKQSSKNKSRHKNKKYSNQNSQSGKKLNFDIDQQNQQASAQKQKKSKNLYRGSSNNKSSKNKLKNQIIHVEGQKKGRAKSNIQRKSEANNQGGKPITRHNSSKNNKRISLNKEHKTVSKQITKNSSSSKKLAESKTISHLQSWKEIINTYSNQNAKQKNTGQNQNKNKIRTLIQKTEKKKLEKQLNDYKIKNTKLQNKLADLKSYKAEYQKLKSIFYKQEKLRKSHKRF